MEVSRIGNGNVHLKTGEVISVEEYRKRKQSGSKGAPEKVVTKKGTSTPPQKREVKDVFEKENRAEETSVENSIDV